MPDITTRPLEHKDLPVLLEMVRDLAMHHGDTADVTRADLERDCLGVTPWLQVLVAEVGGAVSGYAALCPLVQLQFGVRGMDIHHLFVRDVARGRGVGRALINASLELSRSLGCRYVTVGTHPDNAVAAAIYPRMGFDALPQPGPRFRIKL
ncbi:putative acetyltransferase protein [Sulfitobacter noctilucicola]|uniref:GNAT superfamily N-acetyltransferase n=1 Tax=Sulfitobacter noctilucicola TaxID=1342301 RepID=A0A7W6Q2F2_9RHOB|nr:GNAT family N-acetyltransferase [Sulfitobacter noctilucicola]KIN62453.1 putative acetyltransferase protein [Sulfitobacter noctilucicola]MBB4173015.1 GNAT superfamily N-acetyltransferase [Sulfitobacter noctilucicola]